MCAHGITDDFKMCKVLVAASPCGDEHHTADMIVRETDAALQVVGTNMSSGIFKLVSDNGSNMVSAWSRDRKRLPCTCHTFQLSVHKFLEIPRIAEVCSKVRGIVGFFNRSTIGSSVLATCQQHCGLPQRKLIQEVKTRWSSAYAANQSLFDNQVWQRCNVERRSIKMD